jgi:hypothetical protein
LFKIESRSLGGGERGGEEQGEQGGKVKEMEGRKEAGKVRRRGRG